MEVTATHKYLRMSSRKVRLLLPALRGAPAEEALQRLRLTPQAAATPLAKIIRSAVANAEHNHSLDKSTLVVTRATADEGPGMRRYNPVARGRAHPVIRKSTHVTIVLKDVLKPAPKPKAAKKSRSKAAVSKPGKAQKELPAKKTAGKTKQVKPAETAPKAKPDVPRPDKAATAKEIAPRKTAQQTGRDATTRRTGKEG